MVVAKHGVAVFGDRARLGAVAGPVLEMAHRGGAKHQRGPLRGLLKEVTGRDVQGQPIPSKRRTDDRYELLGKFQGVLKTLGYDGVVVLVDRVDEPHLITGRAELMKALIWPMLDNKFLKQPGFGIKLLRPSDVVDVVEE